MKGREAREAHGRSSKLRGKYAPRRSRVAAILAVSAFAMVGSPTPSWAATRAASAKHLTVAFIPGATGVGFYETMEAGAKAEATKFGMGFTYQGAPQFAPSAQIPVVDSVCSKRPSVLLIAPTDPVALRPAIQQCLSAGIDVVLVDTGLTNTKGTLASITSNNLEGGAAAAMFVGQKMHGKGEVATLSLSPTATTQVQRIEGFRLGLKIFYPAIKIVSNQYTAQAESASVSAAESILTANPHLGAFFGAAEPNAEGAARALATSGLKGKVLDVGYDADPSEVSLLKTGAISALVVQQPALEGKLGVDYAHDALTGKSSQVPKSVTLLRNILATTANASSPSISKYYYAG